MRRVDAPPVGEVIAKMKDGLISLALLDEYGGDGQVMLRLDEIDYVELYSLEYRSLEYLKRDRG